MSVTEIQFEELKITLKEFREVNHTLYEDFRTITKKLFEDDVSDEDKSKLNDFYDTYLDSQYDLADEIKSINITMQKLKRQFNRDHKHWKQLINNTLEELEG